MNSITFNFKEHSFIVEEVEEGRYDLNHLRKQIDSLELIKVSFNSTQSMTDWKKYLTTEEEGEYQVQTNRGRGAKTTSNKLGLIAYASWLNTDFKIALEKVFVALSEGRDSDAREIVGDNILDHEFAAKVEERWKIYIKWCYDSFQDVNKVYGANLTRMVVRSATGASTKNNIKGKVGENLIQRCVEQNNGAAILAISSTLDIISNTMKTSIFKTLMTTREGKKEVYKTLSEMLDWSDHCE